MHRRVLLLVLDGWGIAPASKGNAISLAHTPNFDYLWSKYSHLLLNASGEAVGLPAGQIGNSEVGHLNIGAGRVVLQDLPRISDSIKNGSFFHNKVLVEALEYAKEHNKKVHFLGLVSPGGVHSHQNHLFALLELAKEKKVHDVYIHAITDGRDVPPKSALDYISLLEEKIKAIGIGKIATISGRYYAMDRDNRWNRVLLAYNTLVLGRGEIYKNSKEAIEKSYKRGIFDEFIRPSVIEKKGIIEDGDAIVFFNLRSDRPRELTKSLVNTDFKSFKREKILKGLNFVTFTEYEKNLPVKVAFPMIDVKNSLDDVLSDSGIKQLHIAETEKYAHVTFFFAGGKEETPKNEDRLMVPSPKVATYDEKPEMSVKIIKDEMLKDLKNYNFILANFANLDMLGHTGKIPETVKAAEVVDKCLGELVSAALQESYEIIVTADHGNAEKMINSDGSAHTAHTTNQVPLILISNEYKLRTISEPNLSNIAPTILEIFNIPKPNEMTSSSLLRRK